MIESNKFIYRNSYPEIVNNLFPSLPIDGEHVEVDYSLDGSKTNEYVWFIDGKFVNRFGFEMEGVMGFRKINKIRKDEIRSKLVTK